MKVKWGVLSTANIAVSCTIPGMQLAENCELYAIAGRSEDKVNEYKERFGFEKGYVGYEKLLEDPEVQAVYIPLPNYLHKEWVIKALKAHKNVLCEKPLAICAEDAEEMYRTAHENGVILMEAYAYLHSPYIKALKKDIDDGVIGDIVFLDSAFYTTGYSKDIRLVKEWGGGMIYDLGCYCTTLIQTLVGAEPEEIKATAVFTDAGVDELAGGVMRFKNGVRAAFDVGMVMGIDTDARFDRTYIHGTKGDILSLVPYNAEGKLSYEIRKFDGTTEVRTVDAPQNYSLEAAQLGRCILDGEKPYITEEFSIQNARVLDKLLESCGYR